MLSNWKILAVSCLVAGMGLVQTATLAEAGNGSTLAEPSAHVDAPNATDTGAQYQQRAVALVGTLSGIAAAAGSHPVDSTTIRCPKGHCRIEAVMMVQVNNSEADNSTAICLKINGSFDDTNCPYIATLQPGGISEFNLLTSGGVKVDLPKGNYDIEVVFYSDQGASLYTYEAFIKSFTRKP